MREWLEVLHQFASSANLPESIFKKLEFDIVVMYKSGYAPQRALDILIHYNETLDWEL